MANDHLNLVPKGFREIPGFDGKYFINKEGLVWSTFKNRILTQHLDAAKRYLQSLMMVPGRKKGIPRYIHKLVASAWLAPPPGEVGVKTGQYCLNHKDGNKLNNHVDNLEWITIGENTRHAWQKGLNIQIGDTSSSSVLVSTQVREIRLRLILGASVHSLAQEYKVGVGCIRKILSFKNWKHQDHDLIEPMMKISRAVSLRKIHEEILSESPVAIPYKFVEQVVPSGTVVKMEEYKQAREVFSRSTVRPPHEMVMANWYYSI